MDNIMIIIGKIEDIEEVKCQGPDTITGILPKTNGTIIGGAFGEENKKLCPPGTPRSSAKLLSPPLDNYISNLTKLIWYG